MRVSQNTQLDIVFDRTKERDILINQTVVASRGHLGGVFCLQLSIHLFANVTPTLLLHSGLVLYDVIVSLS